MRRVFMILLVAVLVSLSAWVALTMYRSDPAIFAGKICRERGHDEKSYAFRDCIGREIVRKYRSF